MKSTFYFILISLVILFKNTIEANRTVPNEIKPVIYKGLEFRVGSMGNMSYVEAWLKGKKVWEKQIYKVSYNPLLERCSRCLYH